MQRHDKTKSPNHTSARFEVLRNALCSTGLAAMLGATPLAVGTIGTTALLVACEDNGDLEEVGEEIDDELDDATN